MVNPIQAIRDWFEDRWLEYQHGRIMRSAEDVLKKFNEDERTMGRQAALENLDEYEQMLIVYAAGFHICDETGAA